MTRPNFIVISSDQQRGDCIGVEGRGVKTPNLDALCRDGTRFAACITPSVVCQPARASILTGQLCRTHGVHDNGIDLAPETGEKGFAGALGAAGYQTAFFGKAHFSTFHARHPTGSPESELSSVDYGPDWFGPYMGFQHVELMIGGHNWFEPQKPPVGLHFERFFHADGRGDEKIKLYWENAGDTKGAAQTWHSRLPMVWHNTPWTADRAIEWLKHSRDKTSPFCTWISFPDPHHPFDCPEPWSRLHDPDSIELPPHRERDLENRPWWHRAALEGDPQGDAASVKIRNEYSRIPPQTDEQLREIIANTFGQISLIDDNVGRILNALVEAGLDQDTYIIYISDHGDWLGDHGLVLKGPMTYEGLLRVPMIVRGPNVPAGKVVHEPVSTIDIAPTLFALSGAEPLLTQHGQSLVPLIETDDATRDFAMNEWELLPNRVGVALSLRCVRTRTHKLTMDMRSGAGELYDLVNDPDEMVNLFDDPANAEVQARLTGHLHLRPDDIIPNRVPVGPA
jgi:arylsulfatase A-like enzyme